MVRKQIYITQEQDERLKRLAAERGKTEAEVVRTALDNLGAVTYEVAGSGSDRQLREVAVMEYRTTGETSASAARGADMSRNSLADKIWQEELAFIRSLGGEARARGMGSAWKFNREELYEERESKILRRH